MKWLLPAVLVTACGGGGSGSGGGSFGLSERVVVEGLTFPTTFPQPGAFQVVDAFPGLSFASPVAVTHAGDGSDRLFVAERAGRIRVFDNDEAALFSDVFLDISGQVVTGSERGLLGLAFDPDYATNGWFYVYYSTSTSTPGQDHRSIVSRFQVSAGDANAADPFSETVLLSWDQPYGNHNGGCLAFGPDGMLYVSSGDGGSGGDPAENAQNLGVLLGKLLRITNTGAIPADNPFVGVPGAREEIWAYGLRNPWRFSFDRGTGALWLGDVGQDAREEIDVIVAGENYGWDLFEGASLFENPGGVPFDETAAPVITYPRSQGRSVTGGYVYRGTANASLVGAYVYGDYVTGRVWALVWDGEQVYSNTQISWVNSPASFGEDQAGELLVCSLGGTLYRFEETTGPAPDFPELLSETGLFVDTAALEPTPGLVEYDVAVPLWSDGARKRRWLALPGVADIGFDGTSPWQFPLDTVLVKHFEVDTAPGVTRRLETRVLVNEEGGWAGYTYKWNSEQDDAELLPGADTDVIPITGPGGDYDLTWNYPSRADCLVCHTSAAGRVLGVHTRQLNRDFGYGPVTDNQLRAWDHIGLFTEAIGEASEYEAFPDWEASAASVAELTRGYLDANCSNCHRPGGPTSVSIDLRYGVATSAMGVVSELPQAGDVGLVNPFLVAPGAKEDSVLWERMRLLDATRMPPLGSTLVDETGVDVVGQWIDAGAD